MNELFSIPKQAAAANAGHVVLVVPVVLPQRPLKSHMDVAPRQDVPEGNVMLQPGKGGGAGAGVLLKVSDQLPKDPELPLFLLS